MVMSSDLSVEGFGRSLLMGSERLVSVVGNEERFEVGLDGPFNGACLRRCCSLYLRSPGGKDGEDVQGVVVILAGYGFVGSRGGETV